MSDNNTFEAYIMADNKVLDEHYKKIHALDGTPIDIELPDDKNVFDVGLPCVLTDVETGKKVILKEKPNKD